MRLAGPLEWLNTGGGALLCYQKFGWARDSLILDNNLKQERLLKAHGARSTP